jgi:hypothetical protein
VVEGIREMGNNLTFIWDVGCLVGVIVAGFSRILSIDDIKGVIRLFKRKRADPETNDEEYLIPLCRNLLGACGALIFAFSLTALIVGGHYGPISAAYLAIAALIAILAVRKGDSGPE